jgi:3-deoxy-D-manno-octulosonate 8-phosphate phosphatase (KDO 8-P phosphatase)
MSESGKDGTDKPANEAKTPPATPLVAGHSSLLTPAFDVPARVLALAARVRLVLFDVDGVLTDARLILGDDGQEYKAFNSKDGHGLKMMQGHGIAAGIITGRISKVVEHRMRDLDIRHVYQGCRDKHPVYRKLIAELGLTPQETAFVGDDVVDLPIMLEAGLAICPADSHALVRRHAHWITPSGGGQGAGRDVAELMLFAHGLYTQEMMKYLTVPRGAN